MQTLGDCLCHICSMVKEILHQNDIIIHQNNQILEALKCKCDCDKDKEDEENKQ